MARHFKLLPLLLLVLFTFSVSGQLIASIDCGGTKVTTDVYTITWSPDNTSIVSNGVAQVVKPTYSISTVLDTLRVFTGRKKNCYSVGVTRGKKVLVRATFNYGNYDGLLNPPTFDLHLDGNFWTTVQQTSISEPVRYEAIFLAKRDEVSVCLAQTNPGQYPFISSLAIRSVDADVYSEVDEDRALFLVTRLSYGASEHTRYPNDRYDRIWEASPAGLGSIEQVTNDATSIDTTAPNNPPSGIFANAATVGSPNQTIIFAKVSPSFPPLYINMYFSEVSNLGSTRTRSFRISETTLTLENSPIQPPISPPYMKVAERYLYNYKVKTATNLSLVATTDSDLPPLMNAKETFIISEVLTDGTNSNDVKALSLLQSTFDLLKEWRGDPCLPAGYSWDWLSCSNDTTPRVTSLHLDSFGLSGSLPDISSMDALEKIDFHNNSLTGTIPSSLGTMPNLKELNLGNNKLSGSVPSSLSKNNKLKLIITGNPLCTSSKACSNSPATINSSPDNTAVASKKKSNMLPVVLGVTIPAFFLMWIAAGIFIILRRRSKQMNVNLPVVTGNGAYGGQKDEKFDGFQTTTSEEHVNVTVNNEVNQTVGSPSPLLDENNNHNNSDDATY